MEMQRGKETSESYKKSMKSNQKLSSKLHHFFSYVAELGQFSEQWVEQTIYQYGSAYEPLRHWS